MRFLILAILLSFASLGFTQVVINEYCATNIRYVKDNYDKGEDWIELFNTSDVEVNLSGYHLSDKIGKPKKWKIPQGTIIAPKGYLLIWASGRNENSDDNLHTNFRFTQTANKDDVVLADKNGKVIDSRKLEVLQLDHSWARDNDGTGDWKISDKPTPGASNKGNFFEGYTPEPQFDKIAGFYKEAITVNITSPGIPISNIRYTLDGSEVNENSDVVTGPILINKTSVLKARVFSTNPSILKGKMAFATYFINEPETKLPIVSIASELADELANGDRELKPITSFEYFKDGKFVVSSYGELDSHGQDSWINDQRSLDWVSRDEMGYNNAVRTKLFNYSNRDDYQRVILRASGDDNYPAVDDLEHEGSCHIRDEFVHTLVQSGGMRMDIRALERILVYINGEYWGVYTLREKPDDSDYTEYTYKQGKNDILFLKTWGKTWAEYGGQKAFDEWGKIRDFALNNDLGNPENYKKFSDEIDVLSLIDYMIANLSVVSSDWLNYNTGWWKGTNKDGSHKKWGYIMWDNDATFDYYINYSGVPNTSPNAKACDIQEISDFMDNFFPQDTQVIIFPADSFFIDGKWVYFEADTVLAYPDPGRHEKIFLKAIEESQVFRNLYYNRYADMINTTFSCEFMNKKLDSLLAILSPEMPRHIKRWGGSMNEWQSNVVKLKNFINARCKLIDDGMLKCYEELKGPYKVTIVTDPPNAGNVRFNTLTHKSLPWKGEYFGGIDNEIEIIPTGTGNFLRWDSKNGSSNFNNRFGASTSVNLTKADTLIAVFDNGITDTEDENFEEITISPNPTIGEFIISNIDLSRSYTIQIFALDGRLIKQEKLTSIRLNLNLSNGIYNVALIDKELNQTNRKLVVMR